MLGFDPRDWPVVSALLDRAMDIPPESRRAWLDALPPESAVHRNTLARLLAADGGVETNAMFAELPKMQIGSVAAEGQTALTAGARVGPYVLLSEIGHGGMGSVWLAERVDALPRRKVALKLPHLGWGPALGERLARERDILASLAHPNIARLYDAGIDSLGRPYLALEYVDGIPIDRYASERRLGTEDRLRLLLQVAAAVAHAHAHLAVHRDLKPSNILVTADGYVRLLDFGIAKLLEGGEVDDELTRMHGQAMTPDYASPEQIRGERVSTASDVYSLGVVAYELLSGVRPYRLGDSANRLADAIDSVQTAPASRCTSDPVVRRALEGDLDAILNRALKKDASERYATVQAFAADLERHLANEPVLARPDTLGYRLRKYVVRHGLQVAAASAVAAALVAGAGLALWQAHAARLEASHAQQEARRAEAETKRAEQVKRFALSIFEDADAAAGAGAQTTAVDLLRQAHVRVQREFGDRPDIAVELLDSIGSSLQAQGEIQDAAAVLHDALELARSHLGADDLRTIHASVDYGETLYAMGRAPEAVAVLESAAAAAKRKGATGELINAYNQLAGAYLPAGRNQDALAVSQSAIDLLVEKPNDVSKIVIAETWGSRAVVLTSTRADGLTAAAKRAYAAYREVNGEKVTSNTIDTRAELAIGLGRDGDLAGSIAGLTAVLADSLQFNGASHQETAAFAKFLGQSKLEGGDTAGALAAFRTSLKATLPGDHLRVARVYLAIADAQAAAQNLRDALASYDTAAATLAKASTSAQEHFAWPIDSNRALTLAALGRLDEAGRVFPESAGSRLAGIDLGIWRSRLSQLRRLQGRPGEAIEAANTALPLLTSSAVTAERIDCQRRLGEALLAAGRAKDAVGPLRDALSGYHARQMAVSSQQAEAASQLAKAEAEMKLPMQPR
jgi:tetratricopeptide (TPR) repeat protein